MATYVCLIQFKDQGIRNIKDTVKRGDAAIAEAEKMGMKIVEEYWTMGAYDVVVVLEAPDDETMSAFILKVGSLGNVKGQTLRAFRRNEMEDPTLVNRGPGWTASAADRDVSQVNERACWSAPKMSRTSRDAPLGDCQSGWLPPACTRRPQSGARDAAR